MSAARPFIYILVLVVVLSVLAVALGGVLFALKEAKTEKSSANGNAIEAALAAAKAEQKVKHDKVDTELKKLIADGNLPANWKFDDDVNTLNENSSTIMDSLLHGWSPLTKKISGDDIAYIARSVAAHKNPSSFEQSVDPRTHSPEAMAESFTTYILGAPELDRLEFAIEHRLYTRDYDLDKDYKDYDDSDEYGNDNDPEYVAQLLAARSKSLAVAGDTPGALRACKALYTFATQVGEDPYVENQNVAYSIQASADAALWTLLDVANIDETVRSSIAESLNQRVDTHSLRSAIEFDADLYSKRDDFADMMSSNPFFRLIFRTMADTKIDDVPKLSRQITKLLDTPPYQSKDTTKNILKVSKGRFSLGKYRVEEFIGVYYGHSRSAEMTTILPVACALKRYRAEHPGYPDTLESIVPAYVKEIPIDPITGKPILYVRNRDGFYLISPEEESGQPEKDDEDSDSFSPWTSASYRPILWRATK